VEKDRPARRLAGVYGLPQPEPLEEGVFLTGVGGRCHKPPDRPAKTPPPAAALKDSKHRFNNQLAGA